ncbi:MAG: hypothetical protein LC623_06625 [Halobacteriales archaeon]|nr:hypothetical protein [Halobacteriales archaeon]
MEGLVATEVGLVVFGVLALGVALPLLVVAGGAALAAHLRRKQPGRAPPAVRAVLLAPAVLLLAFLVLLLFGGVSVAAFRSGHPVATALSYAAALVTLLGLGYWAMQRRTEWA